MTDIADVAALVGGTPAQDQAPGTPTIDVDPLRWLDALSRAAAAGYLFFDWLTAIDLGAGAGFSVVAHVVDTDRHARLLLRVPVPASDPTVASATAAYAAANWHERETAEMFGITFSGHPDPRPLLLAEDFGAHPMRKDFVVASRAVADWPGAVEPTETRRRPPVPPGVPGSGNWPEDGR